MALNENIFLASFPLLKKNGYGSPTNMFSDTIFVLLADSVFMYKASSQVLFGHLEK